MLPSNGHQCVATCYDWDQGSLSGIYSSLYNMFLSKTFLKDLENHLSFQAFLKYSTAFLDDGLFLFFHDQDTNKIQSFFCNQSSFILSSFFLSSSLSPFRSFWFDPPRPVGHIALLLQDRSFRMFGSSPTTTDTSIQTALSDSCLESLRSAS